MLRLLIHLSCVEVVLGFGECEDRPFQWPRVSLVPRELCKYGFDLSGKGSILPLKQTNVIPKVCLRYCATVLTVPVMVGWKVEKRMQ